jgi:hypothetical protein
MTPREFVFWKSGSKGWIDHPAEIAPPTPTRMGRMRTMEK